MEILSGCAREMIATWRETITRWQRRWRRLALWLCLLLFTFSLYFQVSKKDQIETNQMWEKLWGEREKERDTEKKKRSRGKWKEKRERKIILTVKFSTFLSFSTKVFDDRPGWVNVVVVNVDITVQCVRRSRDKRHDRRSRPGHNKCVSFQLSLLTLCLPMLLPHFCARQERVQHVSNNNITTSKRKNTPSSV